MKNLVLIGFMGSGKTTVGKRVARELGLDFVDVDHRIEAAEGKTITEIFAEKGEAAFREIESRMVAQITGQTGQVIATGGGVALKPQNLEILGKNGILVYLHVDAETVQKRTHRATHRPLLQGENSGEKIKILLAQRLSLYETIPNQVSTVGRKLRDICNDVIRIYKKSSG